MRAINSATDGSSIREAVWPALRPSRSSSARRAEATASSGVNPRREANVYARASVVTLVDNGMGVSFLFYVAAKWHIYARLLAIKSSPQPQKDGQRTIDGGHGSRLQRAKGFADLVARDGVRLVHHNL